MGVRQFPRPHTDDGAEVFADLLPRYVSRGHDIRLRELADQGLGGSLRLVTLVGGSSTGKTRACWELVLYLDGREPGRWWVWHPYDPSRPEAALQALAGVGPYTVVWLNEAQHYLMPIDVGLGERIAAGLRTLLDDPARGPVLVLATLWPQHWSVLTKDPPADQPDPYAQARHLLTGIGTAITMPEAFTPDEMASLYAEADPRLRQAAAHAEAGKITQYLAGAPELENRYRTAPPAARAIIRVAMDARRLGHPLALPHALLEQAAPGYLDDHEWDSLDGDWLKQALEYTKVARKGARGPLTCIRPRPNESATLVGQTSYRLADYLEQLGRAERGDVYPPEGLWAAFTTTITEPELLRHLGDQARSRGRYQHAVRLYRRAAVRGDTAAYQQLIRLCEEAGNTVDVEELDRQAVDRGDTAALVAMAGLRERFGDAGAEELYRQAADRGDTTALVVLGRLRKGLGDVAGAEELYRQAAGRGDTTALVALADQLNRAGDKAGAEELYRQAAVRGDTTALAALALMQDAAGVEALAVQAANRDSTALRILALRSPDGVHAQAVRAADRGDTTALLALARLREESGDTAGADALYRQAADYGDTTALRELSRRRLARSTVDAEALAVKAANRGTPDALSTLAGLLRRAGDSAGADRLRRFGLTGSGQVASELDCDS